MSRTVNNWTDAVDDAYSHLNERNRGYATKKMLALVDDLCMWGDASQSDMITRHGAADFIATTLGHVTAAVHGPGPVPKVDGWYTTTQEPLMYHIDARFRAAWLTKRRLPQRLE
jgi:hypothetical protein